MLKIGDFSKISQVSVKTLRFYDEMGLLKPVEVDRFTGYRYYAIDQLARLYRILALKDLGFSLEEIARLFDQNLQTSELRAMLRLKQHELHAHIQEEQRRLERIEIRLRQLEQEIGMSDYDVVLKKVEPVLVASTRDVIPSYPEQEHLWDRLESYLQRQGAQLKGVCLTVYHSDEPEIDAEVCEPLAGPVPAGEGVQVYELPAIETAASVVHTGPFTTLGEAYGALLKWVEANGYHISGPGREVYLQPPQTDGNQVDPNTVTEVQFPVTKG